MRKVFLLLFVLYINLFILLGDIDPSIAQKETLPLVVETQYFSVYSTKALDVSALLTKLNFDYFLNADSLLEKATEDEAGVLTKTLDTIYSEVSDILGIHSRTFHAKINIYPAKEDMVLALSNIFGTKFKEDSFYFHDENTIYIDSSNLTLGILGHEIAHAIISHYFGVPPPAKVQEVLSGYVEYNLRKSTGTLPPTSRNMAVKTK